MKRVIDAAGLQLLQRAQQRPHGRPHIMRGASLRAGVVHLRIQRRQRVLLNSRRQVLQERRSRLGGFALAGLVVADDVQRHGRAICRYLGLKWMQA